jgi:predicted dehydrogenase
VAISTPPHTHAALVLKAIGHGCHVICEKPFAKDAAEAQAMLDAAEKAGVVHMLGNEFRWEPPRAMAQRAVLEGMIGEPRFFTHTQFLHYAGAPDVDLPDWWLKRSEGGGWIGTWGSHLVDWVRTWLGEFATLSASQANVGGPEGAAEDSFIVRFRLASGVQGALQQSGGAWGPFTSTVRLAGTKGTLWLENGALMLADAEGTREVPAAADLLLPPAPPASKDPRQAGAEWQMMTAVELAPYTMLASVWRAAMEGRPSPSPVAPATFADGVANMRVLDAIRASAASDGAVVRLSAA